MTSKCERCDGTGKEWVTIGKLEVVLPCALCQGFGREPLLIEMMKRRRTE